MGWNRLGSCECPLADVFVPDSRELTVVAIENEAVYVASRFRLM